MWVVKPELVAKYQMPSEIPAEIQAKLAASVKPPRRRPSGAAARTWDGHGVCACSVWKGREWWGGSSGSRRPWPCTYCRRGCAWCG